MKSHHQIRAFTLIEIVISLGILALGILALFSLIPTGIEQNKRGQEQAKAVLLAQSKMEEIVSYAARDWTNFYDNMTNGYTHEPPLSATNVPPFYIGPNTDYEKGIWGWVQDGKGGWIENLGYEWEWHFNDPTFPESKLALITLTVSWPQKLSQFTGSVQNYIDQFNKDNICVYVTQRNIQFIRLISYVSSGL
ncbi:MAG: prepilin-type N-terminal cleavage/methylation domain-containing protein [Candidatus Aureabacteria bacterium]|nr:prepilin-type N-terminal cleavage/methylation domain-containing protein [Candidatus Auribacterota bacterium]